MSTKTITPGGTIPKAIVHVICLFWKYQDYIIMYLVAKFKKIITKQKITYDST